MILTLRVAVIDDSRIARTFHLFRQCLTVYIWSSRRREVKGQRGQKMEKDTTVCGVRAGSSTSGMDKTRGLTKQLGGFAVDHQDYRIL